MQPEREVILLLQFRPQIDDFMKGINRAFFSTAYSCDNAEWIQPSRASTKNAFPQCIGVHTKVTVYRNPMDTVSAQSQDLGCLLNAVVSRAGYQHDRWSESRGCMNTSGNREFRIAQYVPWIDWLGLITAQLIYELR